jgi:hypothetical protein
MINIQIQKKDLLLLSAIMVFLVGVGYVIAFGGTFPSEMGHDVGELEGVQARVTGNCAAGSFIRVIDSTGAVTCEPDTDTNTVSGLVTGWVATTSSSTCAGIWGTGNCGGGIASCVAGHTLRPTGTSTFGHNYYICIRN